MAPREDEARAVRRYQLRTQLESLENQLQNLPQARTNAKMNQIQTRQNAEQQIHQAETQKRNYELEVDRFEEAGRRQLEGLDAQKVQLEAEVENVQRQLERPDDRLDQPRQALEQRLDQLTTQLGGLPAQRVQVESQTANQLQGPRQMVAQTESARQDGERLLGQADSTYEQQIASLDAQKEQLEANIASLQDQLKSVDLEEAEVGQAEGELVLRLDALQQRIEELSALEDAKRDEVSTSGALDLKAAYAEEARRHSQGWKIWVSVLGLAVVLAGGVGATVIVLAHPAKHATSSEVATSIAIQVLVLGLVIYVVRISASQFRAHRHLEAVNRSKAAALETFTRIVAGPSERDVRTAVAAVVAQAVFATEQTGFIDQASDGVTLAENILGPLIQRLGGGAA